MFNFERSVLSPGLCFFMTSLLYFVVLIEAKKIDKEYFKGSVLRLSAYDVSCIKIT